MNIAEHKLYLFRQIDDLPEESLIEVEKLIAQLKANQKKVICSQAVKAIKDFRVNQSLTQIQIKDLIEEGRE